MGCFEPQSLTSDLNRLEFGVANLPGRGNRFPLSAFCGAYGEPRRTISGAKWGE